MQGLTEPGLWQLDNGTVGRQYGWKYVGLKFRNNYNYCVVKFVN